jgi:glycosyltransferase involved in cell wall biosynthesis
LVVALNLLYLIPGVVGGTETYALSLIHTLAAIDGSNEYLVYVNREGADLDVTPTPNFRKVVCPISAERRVVRYAWEQTVLPLQLLRVRPDVVHSLGYVVPLAAPLKQIVSVPDLNFIGHRGWQNAAGRRAFQFFVERSVRRADHVITISEFSRSEVLRYLGVPARKVTVTHLAGRATAPLPEARDDAQSSRASAPGPYILAFSSLSTHKNMRRLLEAFDRVAPSVRHSLVLVGHLPRDDAFRDGLTRAGSDRVHFTGYVPRGEVESLMRNASLLVFPSLYEGFGLPVLDAQHGGVPVACSRAASLPEVAGDGACFFDPLSVEDMAQTIERCLLDQELRATLVSRGHDNTKRFTWEKTARETLDVYAAVAS